MPSTPDPSGPARPKLAAHARVQEDKLSGATMLLYPEGALVLDDAAAEIAKRCDGTRSVEEISVELTKIFDGDATQILNDVRDCLREFEDRGLVVQQAEPA